jgi:predicted Zn-dependent protease
MLVATDGTLAADVRPLVRFNVQVIAEKGAPRAGLLRRRRPLRLDDF